MLPEEGEANNNGEILKLKKNVNTLPGMKTKSLLKQASSRKYGIGGEINLPMKWD